MPEEQIQYNVFLPWQRELPFSVTVSSRSKEDEAEEHIQQLSATMGSSLLAIYTDASSHPKGKGIGVAMVGFDQLQNGSETFSLRRNIGNRMLVYNGELEGITMAFEHAASLSSPHQHIHVYADKDRKSTRLNSSHSGESRMPSSA